MNPIINNFRNIGKNSVALAFVIKTNQNILRYMKYLGSPDPLAENIKDDDGNIIKDQPDIYNDDEIMKNIILRPFDNTDIPKELQVKIFLNSWKADFENLGVNGFLYTLDIICPNLYWIRENEGDFLPSIISGYFSEIVDNQEVAGVGKVRILSFTRAKVNDNYSSWSLIIRVKNISYK